MHYRGFWYFYIYGGGRDTGQYYYRVRLVFVYRYPAWLGKPMDAWRRGVGGGGGHVLAGVKALLPERQRRGGVLYLFISHPRYVFTVGKPGAVITTLR